MTELERELKDRPVARYSLGPTMAKADVLGIAVAVLPFAILTRVMPDVLNGPKGLGIAVGIVAAAVVFVFGGVKLIRGANIRWVEAAVGRLSLDRSAYVATLDNEAFEASVVVTVETKGGSAVAPDVSGLPGTTVDAQGGTVRITSPLFSTSSFSLFGPRPHNGKVHAWFKTCADKVLAPLVAAGTVRAIRTDRRR